MVFSNKFWKKIFTLIIIFVCLLSLTACRLQVNSNQVVWSILGDIKTFNGVLSDAGLSFFFLTYEGLVKENPLTGIKEPILAESWQFSDDKKNILFTLREGLKWSDGQALTVDDVVFTYNQIYLNQKIPNKYQDSLRIGRKGSFPILTKVNEREIKFTITEPFAPFIDALQAPILPKHILKETVEKTDNNNNPKFLTTWGTNTSPEDIIVNGPYKLKEYVTGQRVIFEKNPYYWQKDQQGNQLPNIEKITWAFVDSLDTSLLQFRSGSLDTFWVNPEYFSLLKREEKRGNFTIYNGGVVYGTRFLAFNLNQGSREGKSLVNPIKSQWFNNINFRKAIAYGIDRERMVNNIYRGLGATLKTQISVESPYYNENIKAYNYDFNKAKQILLQEGFIYNQEGELLDKNGNLVEFNVMLRAGHNNSESMGVQIQQDLKKLGIKVHLIPLPSSVRMERLRNSLNWEAVILQLPGGNEPHEPNIWYTDGNFHIFNQKPQRGQSPITGQLVTEWEREIEQLYVMGSQELDQEKRQKIYNKAQELVSENVPYIYLINPYFLMAVRNRFEGVKFSTLGGAFWNIEKLKIRK